MTERLLIILGEGGHTTEMLRLVDLLGRGYEYSYVLTNEDALSAHKISHPGPIYRIRRPRSKWDSKPKVGIKTILAFLAGFLVLLRVRPKAVLSSGPAVGVPLALIGKLLGCRVVFIETASRIRKLSLTGRLVYPIADLFFVQWPELKVRCPRTVYAGRLL